MSGTATLPSFFEPLLSLQYGASDVQRILDGCAVQRIVSLRANTLKTTRADIAAELDGADIAWQPISWYDSAFAISHAREDAIRTLPSYADGKLYLQSLSSMIPALVLGAQPQEDVCDMCAAPGGKTTQIAALTGGKALITACEMHAPRAEKLEHNLRKLGAPNVVVMRTDARQLDEFFSFDRILLDAPCSGSGTLRTSDPNMPKRFTQKLVDKSRKAQRALLSKALSLLKPGGTLVYSTCSVLACENEDVVREAMGKTSAGSFELKPVELPGADDLPVLPSSLDGCLTLCPTEQYEGFFVAKIVRVR